MSADEYVMCERPRGRCALVARCDESSSSFHTPLSTPPSCSPLGVHAGTVHIQSTKVQARRQCVYIFFGDLTDVRLPPVSFYRRQACHIRRAKHVFIHVYIRRVEPRPRVPTSFFGVHTISSANRSVMLSSRLHSCAKVRKLSGVRTRVSSLSGG